MSSQHVLGIGTEVTVSGHPAKVLRIARHGVTVLVAGHEFLVSRESIEEAISGKEE
jgi:hypothetical protein